MTESKVSFTIRRPTPVSRAGSSGADSDSSTFKVPALPRHLTDGSNNPGSPLARSTPPSPKPQSRHYNEQDSSDEEEATEDELVMGFDQFGVQRCVSLFSSLRSGSQLTAVRFLSRLHERKVEPKGPLVIPALKNKDWRELARKRKALYVPPSSAATTGADGSVGGLGTRDTINSGPQLTGLQVKKRVKLEDGSMAEVEVEESARVEETVKVEDVQKEEETEDQRALRAILAGTDESMGEAPFVEIIPAVTEDDAYQQDVAELPDSSTMEDYERVPVSQFGAALLRGMGWKEGMAASKKNKGLVEPWLPQARPALLGIGAKEKEVYDDGSAKGKKGGKSRPDKKYIPIIKREINGSANGTVSKRSPSFDGRGSRRNSRSPDHGRRRDKDRRDDYERDRERDKDRDRDRDGDRRRDDRRDYDPSRRDRERDRDRRRDDRDLDSSYRRDRDRKR